MFDPFKDYETAGYLRNVRKDKDENAIKKFEHNLFRANLQDAMNSLADKNPIMYEDYLDIHHVLFSAYYPWAGQDRSATAPTSAVSKAGILFSYPEDARRAVNEGLRLGQQPATMAKKPGEVMGLFAYGHPFLDGNGRTMLIVHSELCYRAGFSIDWDKTTKPDYLNALSEEIKSPGHGILDTYLLQFKSNRLDRQDWSKQILAIKGLDGLDEENLVEGDLSDAAIQEKYKQFDQRRGYAYTAIDLTKPQSLSVKWNATPASGAHGGVIVDASDVEVIQHLGQGKYVVWQRSNLDGDQIEIGKQFNIDADGSVKRQRAAPGLSL